MNEESIFSLVAEDLLRDFSLEELLEQMNVTDQEALELVLERNLYNPDMPAFIQARMVEYEERVYEETS